MGVTAGQVLAHAQPHADAIIEWVDDPEMDHLAGLEPGATATMTVEVARADGFARYVEQEDKSTDGAKNECLPFVAVPVSLRVSTTDGVLAEEVIRSELVYSHRSDRPLEEVELQAPLDLYRLNGSLELTEEGFDGSASFVFAAEPRGIIDALRQHEADGDNVLVEIPWLARWPVRED